MKAHKNVLHYNINVYCTEFEDVPMFTQLNARKIKIAQTDALVRMGFPDAVGVTESEYRQMGGTSVRK